MCTLRLKGKYQKITFVNIHAPSEEKGMDLKEQFYSKLDEVYEAIPRYDMKIILGDANAKIGREEILMPTIGKHSLHPETNENGYFLVDFAKEKGLIIKSTYHQRKDIYKGTWKSPDGRTVNQIDHVLIEKNEEHCITKVKTYLTRYGLRPLFGRNMDETISTNSSKQKEIKIRKKQTNQITDRM